MIIAIIATAWLMFGGFLLFSGIVHIGTINKGPLPDWLADTLAYAVALVVGPALWAYSMITGKDVG